MADVLGIDPSIFERAAALLARPLSPTALEKEQLQKGRPQPKERPKPAASPSRPSKVKGQGSTSSTASPARASAEPAHAPTSVDSVFHQPVDPVAAGRSSPTGSQTAVTETPKATEAASNGPSSIMGAVAELGGLQKDWKERLQSQDYRKAPVPLVNRKEPKVLTDEERYAKLDEIAAQEQQLQEQQLKSAKASASAMTAAANAAADFVTAEAARIGVSTDNLEEGTVAANDAVADPTRQAEERVKARRKQECQERRERDKREQEARDAVHREKEAKAKALERVTKDRVSSRIREEKERHQQESEESERRQRQKEQQAAGAEELRLQAARRVVEHEQAERRKSQDAAQQEAQLKQQQEEENQTKALEGRERTRLRMQQHTQEVHAQQLAAEEEHRRKCDEKASQRAEQQQQAQLSQQRARARAAEFRQRSRHEEEQRARIDADQCAVEQELAQAALAERQRKRRWRSAEPATAESPRCASGQASGSAPGSAAGSTAPSPSGSAAGSVEQSLPGEASPDLQSRREAPLSQVARVLRTVSPSGARQTEVVPEQPVVSKAVPSRAPRAEAAGKRGARAPPRPPSDRVSRPADKPAGEARVKPSRQIGNKCDSPESASVFDAPTRQSRSLVASVTTGGDDEPVRCTIGFQGVLDEEFFGGDDDEAEDSLAQPYEPSTASAPPAAQVAARRTCHESASGRQSTPEARPGVSVPGRVVARAYSQPPPYSRPPRASSPDGYEGAAVDGCMSPGAASNQSEPLSAGGPAPRAKPQPWKQQAIQVNGADHYLNLLKAARGLPSKAAPTGAMPSRIKVSQGGSYANLMKGASDADSAQAWDDGRSGYGDQMRARASAVEAAQRQEASARQEKGYAMLQRVQNRAIRSTSADNVRAFTEAQLVSA